MSRQRNREQKYRCADYLFVKLYPVTEQEHQTRRRKKEKESSPRQQARNREAARQHRLRLAMTNFTAEGFNVTLTYDEAFVPEEPEQARRELRLWMRRVTDAARKACPSGGRTRRK